MGRFAVAALRVPSDSGLVGFISTMTPYRERSITRASHCRSDFGVKYLWGNQLALRLDVKDNLIFGGHGVDTTHNWSLTGGFEFHWGSGTSATVLSLVTVTQNRTLPAREPGL